MSDIEKSQTIEIGNPQVWDNLARMAIFKVPPHENNYWGEAQKVQTSTEETKIKLLPLLHHAEIVTNAVAAYEAANTEFNQYNEAAIAEALSALDRSEVLSVVEQSHFFNEAMVSRFKTFPQNSPLSNPDSLAFQIFFDPTNEEFYKILNSQHNTYNKDYGPRALRFHSDAESEDYHQKKLDKCAFVLRTSRHLEIFGGEVQITTEFPLDRPSLVLNCKVWDGEAFDQNNALIQNTGISVGLLNGTPWQIIPSPESIKGSMPFVLAPVATIYPTDPGYKIVPAFLSRAN